MTEVTDRKKRSNEVNGAYEENKTYQGSPAPFRPNFSAARALLNARGMLTDPHGTNRITRAIIGCGIRVHDFCGPGVFENVYHECMAYELHSEKLEFELQRKVPIIYRGVQLQSVYYIDIVVEGCVVVELKAVHALAEIHRRQALTQLKLANLPVALLMNFNVARLVEGVKRVVNPNMRLEGLKDDPI